MHFSAVVSFESMETPHAVELLSATAPRNRVTVFGASWCMPDDARASARALYDESVALGAALGKAGLAVVNGGYLGTMEGSARGAREAGADAIGVIVPKLFPHRADGNAYLSSIVKTDSLLRRIEAMIDASDYFVIMPGTLGTLTELCVIWNIAMLSSQLPATDPPRARPLIFCYRDPWERVVQSVESLLAIPPEHANVIVYIDGHADAVARIVADVATRTNAASAGGAAAGKS